MTFFVIIIFYTEIHQEAQKAARICKQVMQAAGMGVVFGSAFAGVYSGRVLSLKDWLSGKVVFMNILETRNLKKYYGSEGSLTKALDGVDFSVRRGEFVAVVGTSGAGKSTLPHLCGGLDTATEGEVIINGNSLAEMNSQGTGCFQEKTDWIYFFKAII